MYFTGAAVISQLLMNNHVIQTLRMNFNAIGDDGITVIATALTNTSISTLEVIGCGITITGARSLAILLSVNQSIRELWLHDNLITTEGACLILRSAVNNEACQVDIVIDDEYCRDSDHKVMMNILRDRQRMKTNMVGCLVRCMVIVIIVIYNRLLLLIQYILKRNAV